MSKLRETVSFRIVIIGLCMMISIGLTACKADSNYFETSNASTGGGGDGTSDSSAGFRLRLRGKNGVSGFMHKFGDISTACEITTAEIATGTPTSIQCMLNMMEYDLWFYGFEYEFNVPKSTCDFVTVTPNYHYQAEAGVGPVSGTMSTNDGVITSCVVDGVAGVIGTYCAVGEGYVKNSGEIVCNYNYSQIYEGVTGAPNCCLGTGNIVLTATVTGDSGPITTTSTVKSVYGGKLGNCIQSPHDFIETWPRDDSSKAVTSIVELANTSLLRNQKIPGSFALYNTKKRIGSSSNFLNAGFHDWATYVANPATWDTARTVPRAFQPLIDLGPNGNHVAGTVMPSVGDGSEDFRCLGGAGEIKYRIRLYTNEWNTIEDYDAYVAGGTASGADPTIAGVTGVDCSAINVGQSCNTKWGFEDMLNEFGGGLAAFEWPMEFLRGSPP